MRKVVISIVAGAVLVTGLFAATPNRTSAPPPAEATEAAEAWLAHVDQGDYARSWSEAARLFQGAVDQETWTRQIQAVRAPLGAVKVRRLIRAAVETSLPGAPDGRYVVIQYRTAFEGKADGVETVTPMLDGDRGWRVSGYYIR